MTDLLEKLFHAQTPKEFVTLFKEVQASYENPQAFLADVADYLPVRLYEHHYDGAVPQSFFGLLSAREVQGAFAKDNIWKPFVQQAWAVTREKKRLPWNLETIVPRSGSSAEACWQAFERAADSGNFEEAFGWVKGFLQTDQGREFFRQQSLTYAMDDTAQAGYKFVYLTQAWRLAEVLNWARVEKILFPPLHFIVTGPKDRSLSRIVKEKWRRNPLPALLEKKNPGPLKRFDEIEHRVLFGSGPAEAIDALHELARAGVGLDGGRDALLIFASQAIANSKLGGWLGPMGAFHFAHLSRYWADLVDPHRKTYALIMTAALLNHASGESRELNENRRLDEVAQRLCPTDTFNVLKSVVSHSDALASATAVYAILGMSDDKKEELFQTLLNLAVKNDGHVCHGNDILFVSEAIECYRRASLPQRDKYIVTAAYFLGRVQKRYEIFAEYGTK